MAITKYDLDINKQAIIKPVVILRQGDHDIDTMQVSLSVANEPMDLTGATVTFMGNTADGRQIIDDAHVKIIDAKGGVFEYVFPSEASSDIGEYKVAYFSIILANGQSSTMDFRVQVLSGVDISAPVASEYISHYDTMVSELNSAYDSFVNETDDKMASTVSSLATSATTVLDSALARVNDVNSTANSASSAASNAVSMASSVASTVTSQASYINSVASSASADVDRALDKINNMSVGGRNLLLDTGRSFTGVGVNVENATFDVQNGIYYLTGGKKVSDLYNQYGPSRYLTISFDWVADGPTISGHFNPQWYGTPWNSGITDAVYPSNNNKSGHYKSSISLSSGGYSTGEATSIQFRQDYLQGNITISNLKLEAGNIATDWTPAPEDADNTFLKKSGDTVTGGLKGGQTILPDSGDLNALTDTGKYYQTKTVNVVNWKNRPVNAPNFAFSVDVIGNGNASLGTQVYYVHTTNRMWVRTIWLDGSIKGSDWAELANDANVVHKTGNETVAGDKTLTGNTTLANIKSSNVKTGSVKLGGMTINFRETAVGVNVYMDGSWQGSFGMGDGYVDSGSIPTSISNPRQNVVLTIIGNGGVGGVTINSPFKLEVLITTEGKIKYRSKSLRDNDTASHTATIIGADSTFYALD